MKHQDTDQGDPRPATIAAALQYHRRGWAPIRVPWGEKAPLKKGWQREQFDDAEDLTKAFGRSPQNIGLLLGKPSGGLVDVDLDALEAIAAGPYFLPATERIHGRASKPESHHWYVAEPVPSRTEQWRDPDGAMLCELRSTGSQTIVPPSRHPSGEPVVWHREGEPGRAIGTSLRIAVGRVAAAALLIRRWPAKGSRHHVALALAGYLLRGGLDEPIVSQFIETVAR